MKGASFHLTGNIHRQGKLAPSSTNTTDERRRTGRFAVLFDESDPYLCRERQQSLGGSYVA